MVNRRDVSASGTPVIDAVDRDHVFLAYGHSIVATSDGGHHWTAVYDAKSDGRILNLSFADPRGGWAVMSNGPYDSFCLTKTIDGGSRLQLSNPFWGNHPRHLGVELPRRDYPDRLTAAVQDWLMSRTGEMTGVIGHNE